MNSFELIANILCYINNNLDQIKISDLETEFNYNSFYIMRLFKKEIGYSIINYINSIKIYKSLDMIVNTNESFLKIALENGFYSLEYYSEVFKKIIGVSPRSFKYILKTENIEKELLLKKVYELKLLKDKSEYYINEFKTKSKIKKISKNS